MEMFDLPRCRPHNENVVLQMDDTGAQLQIIEIKTFGSLISVMVIDFSNLNFSPPKLILLRGVEPDIAYQILDLGAQNVIFAMKIIINNFAFNFKVILIHIVKKRISSSVVSQ